MRNEGNEGILYVSSLFLEKEEYTSSLNFSGHLATIHKISEHPRFT